MLDIEVLELKQQLQDLTELASHAQGVNNHGLLAHADRLTTM